jgi:exonuclease SbcD
MAKILLLGDPHIGGSTILGKPSIGSALNSRVADQLNILEWVLYNAIKLDVSDIIMTGDVFDDPKPHPTIISLLFSWLKKCTDNNINIHIVVGNHDVLRSGQYYMSALEIISAADMEDVYVYKHMNTFCVPGASFTLMPFRDRRSFNVDSNKVALKLMEEKIPYELAGIDKNSIKVVVGHLSIEGSIPIGDEISDAKNELFCPLSMFNGFDYVWMGHIHKPQIMSNSPHIAHIGSMDISNFGESDHKKIVVIFDTEKSDPVSYLEIPTRPLNQISVSVPSDIKNATEFAINSIKDKYKRLDKSIVKVNISLDGMDTIGIDRNKLELAINDLGAFYITRISEERKIAPIKKATATENMDSTMSETVAIKMFADLNIQKEIKDDFIETANSIIKECSAELKGDK